MDFEKIPQVLNLLRFLNFLNFAEIFMFRANPRISRILRQFLDLLDFMKILLDFVPKFLIPLFGKFGNYRGIIN